ncbi:MAG: L-iditol 2-dehydrogenase, partial [Candidatus Bathyarchaeia archaeon]
SKAIVQGLECVRKGGQILLFGAPPRGEILSYDVSKIFINEIRIIPSYSTTEIETAIAAKLLDKYLKNMEKLITHRFPLGETPQAIEFASKGKDVLKVLVKG